MPLLTQKAALLAAVETTPGVAVATTGAANAILVSEPVWSVEAEEITRSFARNDFSQFPSVYSQRRAQVTFSTEVRGGGVADQDGDWSVLLRGCGFSRTTQTGTSRTIASAPTGAVRNAGGDTTTFTTSTAHGLSVGQTVVVAGVTPTTFNGTFVVATVPSSTTFTVANVGTASQTGGSGTASLVTGILFAPKTDALDTLTIRIYLDGIEHVMAGCMGTFQVSAEAGGIATCEWTFTGTYSAPTAVAMPVQTLNQTIPPLVQQAGLSWNGSTSGLFAGGFNIDMGNEIALRRDVNAAFGLDSIYISGRNPTGSFTPEASTSLSSSFWADWGASVTRVFSVQVGNAQGNTVIFSAPATQITGVSYGDRDNIRTYDVNLAFRRGATGNDELTVLFD
jgi:hypothetical protein